MTRLGGTILLTDDAFHATFAGQMKDVTFEAEEVVDVWPYVESIPPSDLRGRSLNDVEYVFRSGSGRHLHVLVGTDATNVFLAVVVDVERRDVFGHHLLDLNEKYGVRPLHP
jgi:hypothetical protein